MNASIATQPENAGVAEQDYKGEALSLLAMMATLLRHRWRLLSISMVVGVLTLIASLWSAASFTSSASFLPQATDNGALSNLSGIAAQFGVTVGAGDEGQSPQFYADLLTSRPILEGVADASYAIGNPAEPPVTLVRYFQVKEKEPAKAREISIADLRRCIRVDVDQKTGVVTFDVTTKSPKLSQALASRMLELVGDFNLRSRRSQAKAQLAFLEDRLQSAKQELAVAEAATQMFLSRNRSYANDPQASFEHDRLMRDLQLRQQVYLSIAQNVEQSRLDAVRNTPLITLIATPEIPVLPNRRYIGIKVVAASACTFLLIAGVLLFQAGIRRNRAASRDAEELAIAVGDARREVRELTNGIVRRTARAKSSEIVKRNDSAGK